MKKLIVVSSAAIALCTMALAQEAQSTGQAGVVSVAPQQPTPQPDYVRSAHDTWAIKCSPAQNNQCYMSQLVLGQNQSPLMEVEFIPAKIEGQPDAIMGGTITTPLNVVLGRGIIVQVDEELPDQKEYTFCNQVGCYARFPVTKADIELYKKAGRMTAVLFAMQNPQQGLEIPLSLGGFTDAFDTLMKIEAGELTPEPVAPSQ